VPEERLDAAKGRALELIVPHVMKERHITYSEEAEHKVPG